MSDREKVIKGLELCVTDYLTQGNCIICPYGEGKDTGYCWVEMNSDALALLKEQEHKDRMFHALEDDWKRLKELLKEQETELCDRCGRVRLKSKWEGR